MDFLPTKGIEYLLVMGYLLLLVPLWWSLWGGTRSRVPATVRMPAGVPPGGAPGWWSWLAVPEALHFHRGHTWAEAEGGGIFRVGLDDFARWMLGRPDGVELPRPGEQVEQGEEGWRLAVDGRTLGVLSPLEGEVVEVNPEVLRSPEVVSEDPYGRGWLLKVRAPRPEASLRNLMPARLARGWIEDAARRLGGWMGQPELGAVLQDGGVPVLGFVRQLDPERWPEIAAELLLTGGEGEEEPGARVSS